MNNKELNKVFKYFDRYNENEIYHFYKKPEEAKSFKHIKYDIFNIAILERDNSVYQIGTESNTIGIELKTFEELNIRFKSFTGFNIDEIEREEVVESIIEMIEEEELKNLVCYTLNSKYNDLLFVSLRSLRKHYKDDILIFTDEENEKILKKKYKYDKKVLFHVLKFTSGKKDTLFNGVCAKIRLFEYPNLEKYNSVLYLDSDTVVVNNLDYLFNHRAVEEGKYLVTKEQEDVFKNTFCTVDNRHFGGDLLNDYEKEYVKVKKEYSFNAGTFCFKPTEYNVSVMRDAYNHLISDYYSKYWPNTPSPDQAYFNYYLYKNNLREHMDKGIKNLWIDKTTKHLYREKEAEFEDLSFVKDYSVIHFYGNIGENGSKVDRMKLFVDIIESESFKTKKYKKTEKKISENKEEEKVITKKNKLWFWKS